MSIALSEARPATTESPTQIAREKASSSWNRLSEGLSRNNKVSAQEFLDETRTIADHMYALSKKEQKEIKKSYAQFANFGREVIKSQIKPALIKEINSHSGKTLREQDLKVAELLGLLGNKLGFGADKDISKALGPDSPTNRRLLKTGTGTAAALALAAYKGPDIVRTLGTIGKAGKYLGYLAEAAVTNDSELSAPQPVPASQKKDVVPPSPSPISSPPPASPMASPPAPPSPESKASPAVTATVEPTKAPTSTKTPEPTATPDPSKEKMVEIGDKNLAEFFLGGWIEELKGKGLTLWENDPSYQERVSRQNAESDNITLVYLGTDNERDRDKHATTAARSDVIMIEVFNPHTFKSTVISLNRDLFVPEGGEYGLGRINELTTLPITRKLNPYPLIQKMLETATGLRIDGILQTNIDFVNGYDAYHDAVLKEYKEGKNSIIDRFVPEGIEVNPPDVIDDPNYPKGYGVQRAYFPKGPQTLHGQDLVKYARARKGNNNNDYMRSERQREVAFKVFRSLASKVVDELEQGQTTSLDLTTEVLKEQQEVGNFFQYDIDIIDMLDSINGSIKSILKKPNGNKVIAKLAANSMSNVATLLGAEASKRYGVPFGDPDHGFTSYGLSSANGSLEDHPNSAGAAITRLRGSGSQISRKSAQGNYIGYWQSLRNKVAELVES